MSVFISYSSVDGSFVDKLSIELIKKRIIIWLDKWAMQPGDSLLDKIQTGLTESAFLLVVLSKNSVSSEWCRKELNSGLTREIKEKKVVVIPVLIEDCEIPIFLQDKLYADFRTDFNSGFQSLIRPLSKLVSEHMGRESNEEKENITDYAVNWGIDESFFFLNLDFVNWNTNNKKSILLQISLIGNENAITKFLEHKINGTERIMRDSIILMLLANEDFRNLDILVTNDLVHNSKFKTIDSKINISFDITIRAVQMGINDGNDILIRLIDFLRLIIDEREVPQFKTDQERASYAAEIV